MEILVNKTKKNEKILRLVTWSLIVAVRCLRLVSDQLKFLELFEPNTIGTIAVPNPIAVSRVTQFCLRISIIRNLMTQKQKKNIQNSRHEKINYCRNSLNSINNFPYPFRWYGGIVNIQATL